MLKYSEKTTTLRARSMINDLEGAMFEATLSSTAPLNLSIGMYVVNEGVYKDNIVQCRADENEFRSYVQGLQDELIAAMDEEETEETTDSKTV